MRPAGRGAGSADHGRNGGLAREWWGKMGLSAGPGGRYGPSSFAPLPRLPSLPRFPPRVL